MAFPAEYWQIWLTNTPEEGPTWRNLAVTVTSEAAAIGMCTVTPPNTECAYPGAEIWHITFQEFSVVGVGLLSRRTATQVTY